MSQAWKKSEPDLWNLYHLSIEQLEILYPDAKHLRIVQLKYKREIDRGRIAMPEKHTFDGNLEAEKAEISKRRKSAPKIGQMVTLNVLEENLAHHQKLEEALSEGAVSRATFSSGSHEGYIKNADNEIEYTKPMENHQVRFSVEFDNEPKWEIQITQLEYKLRLSKAERKERPDGFQTAVVFGDPHFAFRRFPDGSMDPIHDPKALSIALAIIQDVKPERVISAGDMLDYAELSRFEKQPEFQGTMNATLRAAGLFLKSIREMVPDAQFDILEGNHCRRLHKSIVSNFSEAYGWKTGGNEELEPALSVPALMNYKQLGINYVSGYPANRLFLNSELQIKHGNLVKSRDSTAKAVTGDERISTIYGHIHRIEQHGRTMQTPDGPKRLHAYSSGCLCRIDGAVPSTHSSTDVQGRPLENYENWEQGLLVVHYHPDGRFYVEPISIDLNHAAMYRGKVYQA
jgi:hypothetical protein